MTRQELIDAFTLEGINRSNAVVNFTEEDPFDPKAVWLNAEHIRSMPVEDWPRACCRSCARRASIGLPQHGRRITPLIQERIKLLRDVLTVADFFFAAELPPYDTAELIPKKGDAAMALRVARKRARGAGHAPSSRTTAWKPRCAPPPSDLGIKAGQMFQPIRVAVCGRKNAPPLFGTLEVLGRETCLERIGQAIEKLKTYEYVQSRDAAEAPVTGPSNFIRDIILDDLKTNKFGGRVHTRFPPEPNGYLHIGHAKSICLNFGLAAEFGGKFNLRFDDTNPAKEEIEYVDSIMEDVRWLGFDWDDRLFYASDYFDQLYEWAVQLIKEGKAYVCDLTADEVREYRGTLTEPGKEQPLPQPLRRGEPRPVRAHAGRRVPRRRAHPARQDRHGLAQPQPARPGHVPHPPRRRTTAPATSGASTRCTTAPTASPTPSRASPTRICTLEFEDHRPLYDWYLEQLGIYHPQQIEFARLNLTYTVMSKRKLLDAGAGRPRARLGRSRACPPSAGLRRRGYTPEAIRDFCDAHRRGQDQQHHRHRPARALRPRGPEQARRRA